jgi:WD40 repeat protein
VTQWDVRTGREVPSLLLRHPDGVLGMALSSDGRRLITSCLDGRGRVWDVERALATGYLKQSSGDGRVDAVDISPDGTLAVTVNTQSKHVQLWDLASLSERRLPNEDDRASPYLECDVIGGIVWSATFSPDSRQLATVGGATARLWDVHAPRQPTRDRMSFSPNGAVAAADFSPDGALVVTGSWDNSAKIWDAKTGKAVRKLIGGHTSFVNSAVFSPDGAWVLTAGDDRIAVLWNAATGEVIRTFKGHADRVRSAVFSLDGLFVLTASNDRTAKIWNAKTGLVVKTFTGHKLGVLCAAFSRSGNRIVTGSEDNTAKIWDAETGEEIVTIVGHTASINSVAFSPDKESSRVITASEDYTAKLWDATAGHEGKAILNLKGHTQEVTSVRFSRDGRYVCTGSRDGTAMVWLTTPWQEGPAPRVSQR